MQPRLLNTMENFNNLMALRVFVEATMEWQKENKNFRHDITIGRTYFDMGQNWEWTTILITDEDTEMTWQGLCPRDWEIIVECSDINEIVAMAWFFMDNLQKPYGERKQIYEK